jgi:hypothetical protein
MHWYENCVTHKVLCYLLQDVASGGTTNENKGREAQFVQGFD